MSTLKQRGFHRSESWYLTPLEALDSNNAEDYFERYNFIMQGDFCTEIYFKSRNDLLLHACRNLNRAIELKTQFWGILPISQLHLREARRSNSSLSIQT